MNEVNLSLVVVIEPTLHVCYNLQQQLIKFMSSSIEEEDIICLDLKHNAKSKSGVNDFDHSNLAEYRRTSNSVPTGIPMQYIPDRSEHLFYKSSRYGRTL